MYLVGSRMGTEENRSKKLTLKMYSKNIPKQIYSIAIEFECQIHLNVLL